MFRNVLRSTLRSRPAPRPAFRSLQLRSYQQSFRPPLNTRILFRPDGTRRSLLRGLALVVIISCLPVVVFASGGALSSLISEAVGIQRVDDDYATIDFDSYPDCVRFYTDLATPIWKPIWSKKPEEARAGFLRKIALLEKDGQRREEAHTIMRKAVEKVHAILPSSKGADWDAAFRALSVLHHADKELDTILKMREGELMLLRQQRVDEEYYATIDLRSYPATSDYFAKLIAATYQHLLPDEMLTTLSRVCASLENDAEQGEAAHAIMRDVAEKVHDILANNKNPEVAVRAVLFPAIKEMSATTILTLASQLSTFPNLALNNVLDAMIDFFRNMALPPLSRMHSTWLFIQMRYPAKPFSSKPAGQFQLNDIYSTSFSSKTKRLDNLSPNQTVLHKVYNIFDA
ncbi:hypothetical protein B0H19DRAFT_1255644 [Mycena capillaripes]|nr:hypothetical protein B0H19DRAFT_1255644 [Mycena capillaripes]